MLATLGAAAVGMSTVLEVIALPTPRRPGRRISCTTTRRISRQRSTTRGPGHRARDGGPFRRVLSRAVA